MDIESGALASALVMIEQVWCEAKRLPFVQANLGQPIDRLPDIGLPAVQARSERAKRYLARIGTVDRSQLPHDVALTLSVAEATAARMAKEAERYWLVFDPLGTGFVGMFAPTAYCGGLIMKNVNAVLARHAFASVADLDRYLGLIEDLARLIDQMHERTAGQSERGIHIPRAQLDQSIALLGHFLGGTQALIPSMERLAGLEREDAAEMIADRLKARVDPAWRKFIAYLSSDAYRNAAPASVGISQYPGGADVYRDLVVLHTTLARSPEEVHAEGLKRMAAIQQDMAALFDEVGFSGTARQYADLIGRDPRWCADGTARISETFNRYIARIAAKVDLYFNFKPVAPCEVAALPASLSAAMTFGYYDPPRPGQPVGRYFFNADNLGRNSLATVAAITYHELIPGHHFHFATQRENVTLHPLRNNAFFTAFNEGWAEYAATLAGEMGLYEAPEERFGRLVMNAFLTSRLVVDTGMNAFGWTLKKAREYMRANSLLPENEILSETIRYACDIPGQALAYKLGEYFLKEKREAIRGALGDRFDIRVFHDAVLAPGALPLALVAHNIDRQLA